MNSIIHKLLFLVLGLILLQSCKTQKNDILPQKKHSFGYVSPTAEESAHIAKAPALSAGTLPAQFSLDIPANAFDQGQQGSCTSCSVAQSLSIMNHMEHGIPYLDNGIVYSPSFLYNQAHIGDCNAGSSCLANFNILLARGACDILTMPYNQSDCSTQPTSAQFGAAAPQKIAQFMAIDPISAAMIKQYIYSGLPVIIAFQVDQNFENAGPNSTWSAFSGASIGSHCTLLYGWDDSRNAFKMLNSWGNSWGNNGSIWVDYNFLEHGSSTVWGPVFTQAYVMQNPTLQVTAPVANFDLGGANNAVAQNQTITIYDRSTNQPTLWAWTFPGGSPASSSAQNPVVSYANSGSFNVSLTVTNAMGTSTKTITNFIYVGSGSNLPIAQFAVSGTTSVQPGSTVAFLNQSLNNPATYNWAFPGGSPASSTAQNPQVVYNTPGVFSVTLTVTNAAGTNTKTMATCISVTENQTWACGQPFTDPRDGQVYQTVNINGTCWLAENLRYTNHNQVGIVYGNNQTNFTTYGCLYSFSDVQQASLAPPGWHIPSSDEMQTLGQYVLTNFGNNGGVLKSTSNLWAPPNAGANNATGFNALPSGSYYNGVFSDAGNIFYMWTTTAQSLGGNASTLYAGNSGFGGGYFNGNYYLAIRCVKN